MKKILLLLVFFLSIGMAFSQTEGKSYFLLLLFDGSGFELRDVSVVDSNYSAPETFFENVFTARIISFNEELLFEGNFSVSSEAFDEPPLGIFDENSNQIIIPVRELPSKRSVGLSLPYFPDAKEIQILDLENGILLTADVSGFSESACGNGVCERHENSVLCPADCSASSADNLCVREKNGIC